MQSVFSTEKKNLLHYALNSLFEKTKEKAPQENRKWTFLKMSKMKNFRILL